MSSIPVLKYDNKTIVIPLGHEPKLDNPSIWTDSEGSQVLMAWVFDPPKQKMDFNIVSKEDILNKLLFYKDFEFDCGGKNPEENYIYRVLVKAKEATNREF